MYLDLFEFKIIINQILLHDDVSTDVARVKMTSPRGTCMCARVCAHVCVHACVHVCKSVI